MDKEPMAWRLILTPPITVPLKRFMTQKQYDAQSQQIKDCYEPFVCASCKEIESLRAQLHQAHVALDSKEDLLMINNLVLCCVTEKLEKAEKELEAVKAVDLVCIEAMEKELAQYKQDAERAKTEGFNEGIKAAVIELINSFDKSEAEANIRALKREVK